ncbi:MAG: C-GCAxxG-C-C family protein [Bacteroidales bacterium]|nr:C_GCAxxG_C_C family protein [Bacteroidales bacterium]
MLKDHLAEANELFRSGFNCSQAIVAVFSEEHGFPAETAIRMAYPFGRGMGGCGCTCGALTGAMMVIGMKYGTAGQIGMKSGAAGQPEMKSGAAGQDETDNKKLAREKTRRLIEFFENEHGTTLCNDLTGLDQRKLNGPELMAMLPHFHSRCQKFLETVVTFLEEEL